MKSNHDNSIHHDGEVENIKAKLESAKEELKRRYDAAVDKIKQDLAGEKENSKEAWDDLKKRF